MQHEPTSPNHFGGGGVPSGTAFGKHFSAGEIAEIWKLDETTVRRIFQDEPGVLKLQKLRVKRGKRSYVTLRIPEAVALRVYAERSK
jgi:hypothetical protein